MPFRRFPASVLLLCLISAGLSSCLARRRLITRRPTSGKSSERLLVADEKTLADTLVKQYNAVHDFNATVDMTPALGSVEKSQITEYKEVMGYIIFRKPDSIRLIGLYPVVRSKAFDMTSNGIDFRLYIPARNRFVVGKNELTNPSPNKIENLRPQHFLDALLVRPIDTNANKILMENLTDEDEAYYILHEVHEGPTGSLQLIRTIWFNRLDLLLARQLIFDESGNIVSDTRYSQWKPWDNVPFPKHIDINRPRDEYGVVLDITKMDINKGVSDDKFVLEQPQGTTLQVVGQPPTNAPKSQGRIE
jgi:outer membrane lipoprotein-sorting protein